MNKSQEQVRMEKWKVQSPETPGFHEIIVPGKNECKVAHIFRLNLVKGERYFLDSQKLEMHAVLISGKTSTMDKFDSFYIPSNTTMQLIATEDSVFYIAGAQCENIAMANIRKHDPNLPIGDIHQIHGEGVGRREVMFTLPPSVSASRLICGLTWSGNGSWTSWPPHQHEKDLEEVYCYFDMEPNFGFHLSYLHNGGAMDGVVHTVTSGTMVEAPCGYHPTVASPGTKNAYFWALAAFSPEQRRYDLAVTDPAYANNK